MVASLIWGSELLDTLQTPHIDMAGLRFHEDSQLVVDGFFFVQACSDQTTTPSPRRCQGYKASWLSSNGNATNVTNRTDTNNNQKIVLIIILAIARVVENNSKHNGNSDTGLPEGEETKRIGLQVVLINKWLLVSLNPKP